MLRLIDRLRPCLRQAALDYVQCEFDVACATDLHPLQLAQVVDFVHGMLDAPATVPSS